MTAHACESGGARLGSARHEAGRVHGPCSAAMLDLRPNCECCDRDLAPTSHDAFICSFECTFCQDCATTRLGGVCPNCGGELVRRPSRVGAKLARHPGSTRRISKPAGCAPSVPT